MKISKLIILVAIILCFNLASVLACISPQEVVTKSGCTFRYSGYSGSSFEEMAPNSEQTCSLSQEDLNIVKEFLEKGYDVKEQSLMEYRNFLFSAKVKDFFRPRKCKKYSAIEYKDGWTGYKDTGNIYIPFSRCMTTLTKC